MGKSFHVYPQKSEGIKKRDPAVCSKRAEYSDHKLMVKTEKWLILKRKHIP